jgi:HEPN domain-containing protein
MADPQIIREWLDKADEDFDFAESVLEDSSFYAQICFHFHQAVEKYLKAFIVGNDLDFRKIHDLQVLLKSCITKNKTLESLIIDCKLLNGFYIDTRYPVHWPTNYTLETAKEAKDAASNIQEKIKAALKPIISSSQTT